MKEGSAWNACINHIVGFPTAQSLQKFFEWVNCEGVADRLRYWNGKQSMQRMEAEANGTAQRESVGKPEQRTFTTQNALLVTLVKLRTGLGTRVISAWSGIKVSCLTRIFPTWISYLDQFFKAEFPVPSTADMLDRVHPEWREAYGALVRFVLDCTELRLQQPCSRKAARTCYSDYKTAHTAKLLAAVLPVGAYCGTSQAYPGRISDTDILRVSHWLQILQRGDCIPADKGFDQCEALVVARGARIVAPARRWQGQRHYTADERQGNGEKSNLRIHVERHFSRVHNWRAFSGKKLSLYSVDMIEKAFNVVGHLCNLQRPLCSSTSTDAVDAEQEAAEADF